MNKKIIFNISASALNLYYESPLRFYFEKILELEADSPTYECYGESGNLVHDFTEEYIKKKRTKMELVHAFADEWQNRKIHTMLDLKNQPLDMAQYRECLIKSMSFIDNLATEVDSRTIIAEEECKYPIVDTDVAKINCKGFIDVYFTDSKGNIKILDWKTSNSVRPGDNFKRQAFMYAHFLHKNHGTLPISASFYYLKIGIIKTFWFSEQKPDDFNEKHDTLIHPNEVKIFESELYVFADMIIKKGYDISKYSIGKLQSPFNKHLKACKQEVSNRFGDAKMRIGGFV